MNMIKIIKNINLNRLLLIGGVITCIFAVAFLIWWRSGGIVIENNGLSKTIEGGLPKSSISGIACENANRRPISIMLATDPETRPLSGIGEADMVFEMPVTPNGITRIMTVFQCQDPIEIGSIRSARNDFIPLALGLGSIYVHWGGEKEALQKLNGHIIDNIDAMKYEGTVFFRKKGVPMPHNGFTDLGKVIDQVEKLNYGLQNTFSGYLHDEREPKKSISNIAEEVKIDYAVPYNVQWIYDGQSSEYKRLRDSKPEMDRNSNKQVSVRVVVIMKTKSKYLNKDYISVDTQGSGEAVIYQGGIMLTGKWQKDPLAPDSKLYFYDNGGEEIKFLPGKIWVEITTK